MGKTQELSRIFGFDAFINLRGMVKNAVLGGKEIRDGAIRDLVEEYSEKLMGAYPLGEEIFMDYKLGGSRVVVHVTSIPEDYRGKTRNLFRFNHGNYETKIEGRDAENVIDITDKLPNNNNK